MYNRKESAWIKVLRWFSTGLIFFGICFAFLGWWQSSEATKNFNDALWWNGKLNMRRLALLDPDNSSYSYKITSIDVADAEHEVSDLLSRATYFSANASHFFGMSGILIAVGALFVSLVGPPKNWRQPN